MCGVSTIAAWTGSNKAEAKAGRRRRIEKEANMQYAPSLYSMHSMSYTLYTMKFKCTVWAMEIQHTFRTEGGWRCW